MLARSYKFTTYRTYLKNTATLQRLVSDFGKLSLVNGSKKCPKSTDSLQVSGIAQKLCEEKFPRNKILELCRRTISVVQNLVESKRQESQKNQNVREASLENTLLLIRKALKEKKILFSQAVIGTAGTVTNVSDDIKPNTGQPLEQVTTLDTAAVTDAIPEPPPVPTETFEEVISQLNALGEPTLESLGLGGHTPVGWVQNCLEFLHVSLGVPWWGAIVIGTIVIRVCLFPLVVVAQRNAAKMNNYLPQMQIIQLKMTEARQTGNQLEVARYSQELMLFMKEKGLNPFKNMLVPLAQAPVFLSFFIGLRRMANAPVESFRTGGMLWFPDLTIPDQFYLMPIITSVTLYLTIELGTDTAKLSAQNLQTMKYVLRAVPFIILPFTINFPGAVLCYWLSSNVVSLIQVGILRIPSVRDYFKIEPLINYTPSQLPVKPKGFTEGLKDSWTNMKIANELEERRKLDEIQFQRAGKGPLVKTYKYDPTKQPNPNAISAKAKGS